MACEFSVVVKAKLMLTTVHCLLTLLYCTLRYLLFVVVLLPLWWIKMMDLGRNVGTTGWCAGNWVGGVRSRGVDPRLPRDVLVRCATAWQPDRPAAGSGRHLSHSHHHWRSHRHHQLPRLLGRMHGERLLPRFCQYIFITFISPLPYNVIHNVCISFGVTNISPCTFPLAHSLNPNHKPNPNSNPNPNINPTNPNPTDPTLTLLTLLLTLTLTEQGKGKYPRGFPEELSVSHPSCIMSHY